MNNRLKFLCKGGPFNGAYIWLEPGTSGTLVFSLNGQRGCYEIVRSVFKTHPSEKKREVFWKEC